MNAFECSHSNEGGREEADLVASADGLGEEGGVRQHQHGHLVSALLVHARVVKRRLLHLHARSTDQSTNRFEQ